MFLFNSNRIFADILKKFTKFIISKINKIREKSCLQYKVLLIFIILVLAEILILLLNIIK